MTKQSDIEMVAKARAWAVKAHAGQKDKAGKDYFKAHVTVVAEGVKGDPIARRFSFSQRRNSCCPWHSYQKEWFCKRGIQNSIERW